MRCPARGHHDTVSKISHQEQEPIMGQAVQPAPAANEVHYERRRPEETTLYQVIQEHLESFLAQVEVETGASLPEFVNDELDAFLECGILAHGFLRLRCDDCGHETLVAFSCKRRGFCPSCGARRMADGAERCPPGRLRHPARAGAPVGALVSDPARASCSPPIPICSPRCCRSSTASLPPF
jgi:hypothetical protein